MRLPTALVPPVSAMLLGVLAVAGARADEGVQGRIDEAASALVGGNAAQSVASYSEALKDANLANDRRAIILNDRAVAYARLGETKLSIEDFNRAVQLFPEYAPSYNNRGTLLLSIGLTKEALKDFERAILLSPGYAAAYNNRAGAYALLGQQSEALKDYDRAIQLMPGNAVPLSGRGKVYAAVRRPHAAIRDFSRAINADARFAAAYRDRAAAKLDILRTEDAIEDLSRAIVFEPGNAELLLARGRAYLSSDNVPSALKDFASVVELKPGWSAGHAARGLANAYAEVFDEALADLNKAVELDPRSAEAHAFRAIAYALAGQAEVAAKDVEAAAKIEPERAEVLWARAEVAEAQGRGDEAIAHLRRALELRPGLRQAAASLERLGAKGEDDNADRLIAGAGIDKWRVVARANSYFALSDEYPRLRVPLEMSGEGQPRLLEWEAKKGSLKGIGTLRFSGGSVTTRTGKEEVELVAIIDLAANSVVGIEPHRQGSKVATWQWDEGKVTVASVDGVTDEFILRATKAKDVASAPVRRYGGSSHQSTAPGWAPWADGPTMGPRGGERQAARPQQRKPKTLFDLLFN